MRLFVLCASFLWAVASPARAEDCADERLSDAAAELLAHASTSRERDLEDAVRQAGSNAVSTRMVRAPIAHASLAELSTQATSRDGALAVCGEAETDGIVVRIVGRSGGRLSAALVDEGLAIDVSLVPGLTRPRLVVRATEGTSFTRELSAREGRVVLPAGFPESFVAQIVADAVSGPQPVAELRFGEVQTLASSDVSDVDAQTHVARVRRLAGVSPLRASRVLDSVAHAHAASVCELGQAVHEVDGVGPVERLRRAGIEARSVGEVVSRAASRAAALTSFDESPSHHLALESEAYTDAGYGEVTDADGRVCVVIVLAAWPRYAGR